MKTLRNLALSVAFLGLTAVPAKADFTWTNVCGGNSFITCSSGGLSYDAGTKTITVMITNLAGEGDIYTAVGLFNLPEGVTGYTSPDTPTWSAGEGINGGGLPGANSARYALVSANGVNDGIPEDALTYTFTFTFANDISASLAQIGVGVHAQSGPNGCSTKFGIMGDGSDGYAVNNSTNLDPDCSTTVPEPASMFLFGAGVAGLLATRRRRNAFELENDEV